MRAFRNLSELIMISGDKGISKYYSKKKGILIFRAKAYVGAAGLFILFIMFAMLIARAEDPSKIAGKLFLSAVFGSSGLYLILIFIVSRVYIGAESIAFRNAFGMKKNITWDDLKAVYKASQEGAVKVCSEKNEIMIYSYFKGLPLIRALLEKFRPGAFDIESLLESAAIPGSYRKKNRNLVFRVNKLIGVFIILFILIALGPALSSMEKFEPIWGSQLAAKLAVVAFPAVPVLLILLYCLSIRVSIDPEKIEYKSFFGLKKEISWKDIISCETYVRNRNIHLKLCSLDRKIVVSGIFSGFELMLDIIKKYCPEKHPPEKGKRKKQDRK